VWEVINETEPELTGKTRILRRSEMLGFPPVACPRAAVGSPGVVSLRQALLRMARDAQGREILAMLRLDGFAEVEAELFDGIAVKLAQVRSLG
jgi:phosphonate transport system substrate-binding protein